MDRRLSLAFPCLLLGAALAGCDADTTPAPPRKPGPLAEAATQFDPTTAGAVTGRVAWAAYPPLAGREAACHAGGVA